jgi:hypothetical protein
MIPAIKLSKNVLANLQIASFQPRIDTLRKNISGSIDGEATQNANTGARGTPPINNEDITGITPQEQNGLIAPTAVAKMMANQGDLVMIVLKYLEKSLRFIHTASGIVISK